jgi:hypothetical protein
VVDFLLFESLYLHLTLLNFSKKLYEYYWLIPSDHKEFYPLCAISPDVETIKLHSILWLQKWLTFVIYRWSCNNSVWGDMLTESPIWIVCLLSICFSVPFRYLIRIHPAKFTWKTTDHDTQYFNQVAWNICVVFSFNLSTAPTADYCTMSLSII